MLHKPMIKIITFNNGAELYISEIESVIYGHRDMYTSNIRLVISMLEEYTIPECINNLPKWIQHFYISIRDLPTENIMKHFNTHYKYIIETLDSGNSVLIHCRTGISVSITLLIAILLKNRYICSEYCIPIENKNFPTWTETILEYIRTTSGITLACPNYGFMEQLYKYEKKLEKNAYIYKLSNLYIP